MAKQVESALNELIEDVGGENPITEESQTLESGLVSEGYPRTQAEVMAMDKDKLSTFTPEQRKQLAQFYTSQIKVSLFQTALSLVAIKTLELYRDLGYEKFTSYVEEECGMSTRYANELTLAVEEYGSGDRIKELMESSPKRFLKAVRDTRAKQLEGEKLLLSDGSEVSAEEYIKERIEQMESSSRQRIKKLESELRNLTAVKDAAVEQSKNLEDKYNTAKEKLDTYKKSKELDPDRILRIKEQREAEKIISDRVLAIDKALQDLIEIPQEIRNNALGLYIARTISTLDVTLKQVRMDWGAFIIAGEQEANG